MVKLSPYVFLFLPCLALAAKQGNLTYSQYNSDISKSERDIDYRKSLLKFNEFHLLIPVVNRKTINREDKVLGRKNRNDHLSNKEAKLTRNISPSESQQLKKKVDLTRNIPVKLSEYTNAHFHTKKMSRYLPPSAKIAPGAQSVVLHLSGSDFKGAVNLFGIPIGTKIRVKLDASASSIQPGFVALHVLDNVVGDKRMLRSGAILFGRPSAIKGSSQLFVSLYKGITPEHIEFSVRGSVSDSQDEAGLSGSIISDGKIINRSLDAGIFALGSAAASTLLPTDIATTAAQTAADTAITEKRKESAAKLGVPAFIVIAKPQEAYVYIEETF